MKNKKVKADLTRAAKAFFLGTALGLSSCQIEAPIDDVVNYENIGNEDFVIENHSPLTGLELQAKIDQIIDVYMEMSEHSPFFINYMRSRGINTIIAELPPGQSDSVDAWIRGGDTSIYFNYKKKIFGKDTLIGTIRHELIHLMQYEALDIKSLSGLRPDVRGAIDMFVEFHAWFFGSKYDHIMPVGFEKSDEIQNSLFLNAVNPRNAGDELSDWMCGENCGLYTRKILSEGNRRKIGELKPVSDEQILSMMSAIANSKDPATAGVGDENLMTAYRTLRDVITGKSPYIKVGDTKSDIFPDDVDQADMDKFLAKCAEWDSKLGTMFANQSVAHR